VANNVTQRRFVPVYFRLAQILRQQRQLDNAVTQVEAGLRFAPQDVEGQILLGQLLTENGDQVRALKHYRNQLTSSLPVAEERAVIGIKADRLATGHPGTSITPPDFSSAPIYPGLAIGIVAVNHVPAEVSLSDICVILESSWLIHCEVLPPLTIPDAAILNETRGQYDADLMLKEVERRRSSDTRGPSHVLAITGRDIFAPQTSYVFSWQRPNEAGAVGVLSASRFTAGIPDYYEPEILATRRVALQALSTTGSMFGFTRPTDPACPLAYPESFREFQHKRLRLCPSDEQQRDQLLGRRGGTPDRFGRSRSDVIARIYQKYFIE
jgi:predicted Zn-dependent protease